MAYDFVSYHVQSEHYLFRTRDACADLIATHFLSLELNMNFFSNFALICLFLFYSNLASPVNGANQDGDKKFTYNIYKCRCDPRSAKPSSSCNRMVKIQEDGIVVALDTPRVGPGDPRIIGSATYSFLGLIGKTSVKLGNDLAHCRMFDFNVPIRYAGPITYPPMVKKKVAVK